MKVILSQVLFRTNKFDPKTSRGADNVRSFYRADSGYEIELDSDLRMVRVACNGRHNLVPEAEVLECRAFDEPGPMEAIVRPKTEAVKVAEGAYLIRPKVVDVDDVQPEPAAAAKRGPGRPRKNPIAASA